MASGVELATAYIQLIPSLRGAQREIQRQMGPLGSKAGHEFGEDFSDASGAEVEKSGGGVKGAIGNAGSFGADFGKKFGLAAAAGIGLTVGASIKSAIDQEVETDRVAASLGASPREAARIGQLAGKLYGENFGDSIGGVAEGIGAVRSSFRELGTGKDLKLVTEQALNFADIFRIDLPRAVSVARTVVESGLAGSASEALDLLTASAQKVGPALSEDILDAGEEYSKFFAMVGLDGEQAFTALVAGAKAGTFGIDLAGDAIKEFGIRATDLGDTGAQEALDGLGLSGTRIANDLLAGGKSARAATSEIATGLLSITNPAKRATAVTALFGTQIEDIGKGNITKFLTGIKAGSKGLGNFEGAIDRAGVTANDNASRNIEAFKRQVTQTFVNLIGKRVLPFIKDFAATLSERLAPIVKRVREGLKAANPVLERIGKFLNDNAEYVKTFAAVLAVLAGAFLALTLVTAAFSIALNSTGIPLLVIGVAALVAGLVIAYKRSDEFRKVVNQVGVAVKQFGIFLKDVIIPAVVRLAQDVGTKLKPIFDQLVQTFVARVLPTLQKVFARIREAMPAIQQIATFVLRWVGTLIRLAATILGKVLPVIIRLGGFLFSKIVPAFAAVISGAIRVVGALAKVGNKILTVVQNFREFAAKVSTVVGNVITRVENGIGSIPGIITGKIGEMVTAGKEFIGGLFEGIKSAASGAGGVVADIASSVSNAVRDALNGLIRQMNDAIPDKIGKGKFSINLPNDPIPGFARGTNYAPGGVAIVGEEGPELVNLRRGSQVKTAAQTRALMAGGGVAAGGGMTAMLSVNGQQFPGYLEWIAGNVVATAQDMSAERSRATWSRT